MTTFNTSCMGLTHGSDPPGFTHMHKWTVQCEVKRIYPTQVMSAEQTWANLFPLRCWKDRGKELSSGKSQLSHEQTPKPRLPEERGELGVIQP